MEDLEVRDLFAMLAMCGDLAGRKDETDAEKYTFEAVANRAYTMADAMIEARQPQSHGLPAIKRKPRK